MKTVSGIHTYCGKCIKQINSNQFVTGGCDNIILIFDINSYSILKKLNEHTDTVNLVSLLSNGLLVSSSLDKSVKIWNLTSGVSLSTFNPFSAEVRYAIQLSTGLLAVGGLSGSLYFYDVSTPSSPAQKTVWSSFFSGSASYGLFEYQSSVLVADKTAQAMLADESTKAVSYNFKTPSSTDAILCLEGYTSMGYEFFFQFIKIYFSKNSLISRI